MAKIGLGFQISASAAGMARGINAGVVELRKLGLAAKETNRDLAVLKSVTISTIFINSVSAIANTFRRFTSGSAAAIDSTAKLSRSLGVTFGELRQLNIAADLSGSSSEQVARAFVRGQVAIDDFRQGVPAASAAFARLGISLDSLAGRGSIEQFQLIAEAIADIEDPTTRAALASDIFGRSGAKLLPLFGDLSSSLETSAGFLEQFGGALTNEQARAVEAVNDAFTLFGEGVSEVTGKILAELSPALVKGAQEFQQFLASLNVEAVADVAENALSALASVVQVLSQALSPIANNLLPAAGAAMAFLYRQTILVAGINLATLFSRAATALFAFATGANSAAAATLRLAASFRALAAATLVGVVITGLGALTGLVVEWALQTAQATKDAARSFQEWSASADQTIQGVQSAFNDLRQELDLDGEITLLEARGLKETEQALIDLRQLKREVSADGVVTRVEYEELQEAYRLVQSLIRDGENGFAALAQRLKEAGVELKNPVEETSNALEEAGFNAEQLQRQLASLSNAAVDIAVNFGREGFDIAVAAQAQIDELQRLVDVGVLNSAGFEREAARIRDSLRDAERALQDRQRAAERLAERQAELDRERADALGRRSFELLQVDDIRTAAGQELLLRLEQGEDPALEEARRQTRELQGLRRDLARAEAEVVDIL
jgi:hypothetical protein